MKEINVLFQLLNSDIEEPVYEDITNVNSGRLLDLIIAHHLIPVFSQHIEEVPSIPTQFENKLRNEHRKITRRSLLLTSELCRVLDRFEDAAVRAIPYKGPVLSRLIHGDINERQFVDLDLLVSPDEFDHAERILKNQGYKPFERLRGLGEAAFRNEAGAIVDLHRRILPRYHPGELAFDALWTRRNHIELQGRTVPILDDIDRMIALSVHGAKHCWYRLGWVNDFALLSGVGQFDQTKLHDRARNVRAGRHLQLGRCLATEISTDSKDSIDRNNPDFDNPVNDCCRRIIARIKQEEVATPPSDREQFEFQWRLFQGIPAKARFGFNLATIPSQGDFESIDLPLVLSPIYRLIRPTRLALRLTKKFGN